MSFLSTPGSRFLPLYVLCFSPYFLLAHTVWGEVQTLHSQHVWLLVVFSCYLDIVGSFFHPVPIVSWRFFSSSLSLPPSPQLSDFKCLISQISPLKVQEERKTPQHSQWCGVAIVLPNLHSFFFSSLTDTAFCHIVFSKT